MILWGSSPQTPTRLEQDTANFNGLNIFEYQSSYR